MRIRRIAAGFGLREYAELVGLLPSQMSDMENGYIEPDESLIAKKEPPHA